jgi:hypothetical protein
MLPDRRSISRSPPWFAEDLLPETSLGGDTGVWRGQSEQLGIADIAAQLRNQKEGGKGPDSLG